MVARIEVKYYSVDGKPTKETRGYDESNKQLFESTTSVSRNPKRIAITAQQYVALVSKYDE